MLNYLNDIYTLEQNRNILQYIHDEHVTILCSNPVWTCTIIGQLHIKNINIVCHKHMIFPKHFLHGMVLLEIVTFNIPNITKIEHGCLSSCLRLKEVYIYNITKLPTIHYGFLKTSPVNTYNISFNKTSSTDRNINIEGVHNVQKFVNI
jgi:hypothetical protein